MLAGARGLESSTWGVRERAIGVLRSRLRRCSLASVRASVRLATTALGPPASAAHPRPIITVRHFSLLPFCFALSSTKSVSACWGRGCRNDYDSAFSWGNFEFMNRVILCLPVHSSLPCIHSKHPNPTHCSYLFPAHNPLHLRLSGWITRLRRHLSAEQPMPIRLLLRRRHRHLLSHRRRNHHRTRPAYAHHSLTLLSPPCTALSPAFHTLPFLLPGPTRPPCSVQSPLRRPASPEHAASSPISASSALSLVTPFSTDTCT